jgi:hypothetical protein
MKKVLRLTLVIGALLMAFLVSGTFAPAHAATYQTEQTQAEHNSSYVIGSPASKYGQVIGGVDFVGYCQSLGWNTAKLTNWSAGGWECYTPNLAQSMSTDSDAACNHTYQTSGLEAVVTNWYSATSIVCVRPK